MTVYNHLRQQGSVVTEWEENGFIWDRCANCWLYRGFELRFTYESPGEMMVTRPNSGFCGIIVNKRHGAATIAMWLSAALGRSM